MLAVAGGHVSSRTFNIAAGLPVMAGFMLSGVLLVYRRDFAHADPASDAGEG